METEKREPITPRFKENQRIINTLLLLIHIIFFFMFLYFHIYVMVIVNIGSIGSYILNFIFIERSKYLIVYRITYYEILIHLILATISLGNSSGFIMIGTILPAYLFFTMRGVLLEPNTKNIKRPFAYLGTAALGMVIVAIRVHYYGSIYVISNHIRLVFQIIIIILIMGAFSGVVGYFLEQMQWIQFDLIAQKNKFVRMSRYDALTGLYNRGSIQEYMERAVLKQEKFSVILCDIDDFKQINDTYGHICGDQVLLHISNMLRTSVMKHDMVGRWGGEEILIILQECSLQRAKKIAEWIRKDIEQEKFFYEGKEIRLTITLGVVEPKDGESVHDIVKKVDEYLYKGKDAGKNCVMVE